MDKKDVSLFYRDGGITLTNKEGDITEINNAGITLTNKEGDVTQINNGGIKIANKQGDLTQINKDGFTLELGSTGSNELGNPLLSYNINTKKISYNQAKTFVIDHPEYEDKLLVHACLEGPEAGVYYRGKATIENNNCITIVLPNYVDKLAKNFTVHLTQIYDELSKDVNIILKTTEVVNNRFTVHGPNCNFFWIVYGERLSIEVEPLKKSVNISGEGPYKWVK